MDADIRWTIQVQTVDNPGWRFWSPLSGLDGFYEFYDQPHALSEAARAGMVKFITCVRVLQIVRTYSVSVIFENKNRLSDLFKK